MTLREGGIIKKDKSSMQLFSVSGLVLSVAGVFSGAQKTVSVTDENIIAEKVNAENRVTLNSPARDIVNAENRVSSNNPACSGSRHEKSVLELIKLDFKKHRRVVIAIGAILLILSAFFFYTYMKAGIVLLSLIFMGAISRVWQRFFPFEFGIELVMLATVVSGVTYGAAAGLIVGFVSLVLSTLLTQEDHGKMWPAFITIMVIGFLAGTLTIANIALWGVIFTVLYDAIISVIYISSGHSAIKTLVFDATHIAFNYFVFYHIAPTLVSIVA
ncbi:MAG: hypothetical protein ABIF85_05730 [Nanoarchaeota archaeon]|nr:hypothetical protein [Nanoarchaeota archaeon]MBU4299805.1 hypothetical protein [Nanoarchaeota archaeon]MBU4452211.1 hypothetical protein [Nanoarchaeota archaeon]MCG2723597.1 hypothetical protein [archaeon]